MSGRNPTGFDQGPEFLRVVIARGPCLHPCVQHRLQTRSLVWHAGTALPLHSWTALPLPVHVTVVVMTRKCSDRHHRRAFQWASAHCVSPPCVTDEPDPELGALPGFFLSAVTSRPVRCCPYPHFIYQKTETQKTGISRPHTQDTVDSEFEPRSVHTRACSLPLPLTRTAYIT